MSFFWVFMLLCSAASVDVEPLVEARDRLRFLDFDRLRVLERLEFAVVGGFPVGREDSTDSGRQATADREI